MLSLAALFLENYDTKRKFTFWYVITIFLQASTEV